MARLGSLYFEAFIARLRLEDRTNASDACRLSQGCSAPKAARGGACYRAGVDLDTKIRLESEHKGGDAGAHQGQRA